MIKRLYSSILFFASLALLTLNGCSSDSTTEPSVKEAPSVKISGWYTNPDGDHPTFVINRAKSDTNIHYGNIVFSQDASNVYMDVSHVSVSDPTGPYAIDSFKVYDARENASDSSTYYDSEFRVTKRDITKLAVALALDVSSSLANNFGLVKSDANAFLNDLATAHTGTELGVAAFASDVTSSGMTTNVSSLTTFINNLQQGQYTKLYDGMYEALQRLKTASNSPDTKVLVVFTDGVENASVHSLADVTAEMAAQNVKCYTLGFNGSAQVGQSSIDEALLKTLAATGQYMTVSEGTKISDLFSNVSRGISNTYDFHFTRSKKVITQPQIVELRFYAHR